MNAKLLFVFMALVLVTSCKDDPTPTIIQNITNPGQDGSNASGNNIKIERKDIDVPIIGTSKTKNIIRNSIMELAQEGSVIDEDGDIYIKVPEKIESVATTIQSGLLQLASDVKAQSPRQIHYINYYKIASKNLNTAFDAVSDIQEIMQSEQSDLSTRDLYFKTWYEGVQLALTTPLTAPSKIKNASQFIVEQTSKNYGKKIAKSIAPKLFNAAENTVMTFFDLETVAAGDVVQQNNRLVRDMTLSLADLSNSEFTSLIKKENMTAKDYQKFTDHIIERAKQNLSKEDYKFFKNKLETMNRNSILNETHFMAKEALLQASENGAKLSELSKQQRKDTEEILSKIKENDKLIVETAKGLDQFARYTNDSLIVLNEILSKQSMNVETILDFVALDLPPSKIISYYENKYPNLENISVEEKNRYDMAKEQKLALDALISIGHISNIASNLGIEEAGMLTTLFSSAIQFTSFNTVGILGGIATFTSLMNRPKPDPRFEFIIKNLNFIADSLLTINKNILIVNDNVLALHASIKSNFDGLMTEVKKLDTKVTFTIEKISEVQADILNIHHSTEMQRCSLLTQKYQPRSFKELQKFTSYWSPSIETCKFNLYNLFRLPQIDLQSPIPSPLKNLRLIEYSKTPHPNTSPFYSKELLETYRSLNTAENDYLLAPNIVSYYVQILLDNIYLFEVLNDKNMPFENISDVTSKIKNSEAHYILSNAKTIVQKAKTEFKRWAETDSINSRVDEYLKITPKEIKELNCENEYSNIICRSIHNPVFFNNLISETIRKTVGYEKFKVAASLFPNNPTHLNDSIGGPLKIVWIGEGASEDFKTSLDHGLTSGDIILDQNILDYVNYPGMYFMIETESHTKIYPVPSLMNPDAYKEKLSYQIPGYEKLEQAEKAIQLELDHLEISQNLEENTDLIFNINNFYLMGN